jgi:hypothetical protein
MENRKGELGRKGRRFGGWEGRRLPNPTGSSSPVGKKRTSLCDLCNL